MKILIRKKNLFQTQGDAEAELFLNDASGKYMLFPVVTWSGARNSLISYSFWFAVHHILIIERKA